MTAGPAHAGAASGPALPWAARPQVRLAAGLVGLGGMGMAHVNALPFLTGALIDARGFSATLAGAVNSVELVCSALLAILLSRPAFGFSPRRLGTAAAALFLAGNLASLGSDAASLFAARAIAGLGLGLAVSAGARGISRAPNPAATAAAVALAVGALGFVQALSAGALVTRWSYPGGYLFLAAMALVALGLARLLPADRTVAPEAPQAAAPAARWALGASVIVAACMLLVGSGAVWSFSERIGLAAGLSRAAVTAAIGVTGLATIAGAAAAVWAARLGRDVLMASVGVALFGASVSVFAVAPSPAVYAVALTVLSFAFLFVGPFVTAIAVRADPTGGLASAAQGAQLLVGSAGPFLGGALLGTGSSVPLAALTAATSLIALAGIWNAGRLLRA